VVSAGSAPERPAVRPERPAVRLRPVPPLDPPYADDIAPAHWLAPGARQLPLDLTGAMQRPHGRAGNRPGGSSRPSPSRPPAPGPPPAPYTGASAEATRAAQRYVATCLEIINGFRPVTQIRPLTRPADTRLITARLDAAAGRFRPVGRRTTRAQLRVRRVRVCEPRPGAVEIAAVLAHSTNGNSLALALRLERHAGTWVGTVLQLL